MGPTRTPQDVRPISLPVPELTLLTLGEFRAVFDDGTPFWQLIVHNVDTPKHKENAEKLRVALGSSLLHEPERCMCSGKNGTAMIFFPGDQHAGHDFMNKTTTREWFMITDDKFVTWDVYRSEELLIYPTPASQQIGTLMATTIKGTQPPSNFCANMPQGSMYCYRLHANPTDYGVYCRMFSHEEKDAPLCLVWRGIPVVYSRPPHEDMQVVDTAEARNIYAAVSGSLGKLCGLYVVSTRPLSELRIVREGCKTESFSLSPVYMYDLSGYRLASGRVLRTGEKAHHVLDLQHTSKATHWVVQKNSRFPEGMMSADKEKHTLSVGAFLSSESTLTILHVV